MPLLLLNKKSIRQEAVEPKKAREMLALTTFWELQSIKKVTKYGVQGC